MKIWIFLALQYLFLKVDFNKYTHNTDTYGTLWDDAVHKAPNKIKTFWQNQLINSILVHFKVLYRTRCKNIGALLVQWPWNNITFSTLHNLCFSSWRVLPFIYRVIHCLHLYASLVYWSLTCLIKSSLDMVSSLLESSTFDVLSLFLCARMERGKIKTEICRSVPLAMYIIDGVTSMSYQQRWGTGLLICLNEPLHCQWLFSTIWHVVWILKAWILNRP